MAKNDDTDGPCDKKQFFDQSKSTTYQKDGRSLIINDRSGSVSGFLGIDTVSLGDKGTTQLDIQNTTFGQADELSSFFIDKRLDGILGLAFRSGAVDNVQPVFQVRKKTTKKLFSHLSTLLNWVSLTSRFSRFG
jgi:hypothetical protein